MRIPQVGESGWQVVGDLRLPKGKWFDCEVTALVDGINADGKFANVRLRVGRRKFYTGHELLRRKPQQTDTQAADESFQRDLKQMLAPSRVRS